MNKKITILLIITFLAFLFIKVDVLAYGQEDEITAFGTRYYVYEERDYKELGFGVTYYRHMGYTRIDQSGLCTSQIGGSDGGGSLVLGNYYHQQTNVLELDTTESLKIVPHASLNGSAWELTSVRKSAEMYEHENPGWRVVAAINGDYFNTAMPYGSTGVTISEGENFKTYTPETTLIFKNNGIGDQIVPVAASRTQSSPYLSIYDDNGQIIKEIKIDGLNKAPGLNETTAYFAQRTANNSGTFAEQKANNLWMVRSAEKAVTTIVNYFYGIGKITEFVTSEFKMSPGEFGIASNNSEITELLKKGVKIRLQWEFTDSAFAGAENCISVPFSILTNGANPASDTTRHPRTMIGVREDGTIVMTVVDGRQVITRPDDPSKENEYNPYGFHGLCGAEMATVMKYYGCVNAWNLDGGGSSTILVRKQDNWKISFAYRDKENPDSEWYVANSPSDGAERRDGNCLLIVAKVPVYETEVFKKPQELTINIATIEAIEEYRNLYIELNGIKKKVEDGIVNFDGLNANTTYVYKFYAQIDGEFVNLFIKNEVKTALPLPELVKVLYNVNINNQNVIDNYSIRYSIRNTESFVSAVLIVGDNEYKSKGYIIDLGIDEYNLMNASSVKLVLIYNIGDGLGNKELVLEDFNLLINSLLIFQNYINNDYNTSLNDIFK